MTRRRPAATDKLTPRVFTSAEFRHAEKAKRDAEDERARALAGPVVNKRVPSDPIGTVGSCTKCYSLKAQMRELVKKAIKAERAGRKPDLHGIDVVKRSLKECDHLRAVDR